MGKGIPNPRSKLFCLVLYPEENAEHQRVLTLLKEHYVILGINHNRDVWHEYDDNFLDGNHYEGEIKKPHHHVIVKFENARYLCALAKELGCEHNLIRKIGSFRSMAIYLTHRDYPKKAQYNTNEFYGLLIGDLMKCIGDDTPDVQFLEILVYLKGLDRYMSYTDFNIFLCTNGYASTLRKYSSQIRDCFYECQGKYHAQQVESKILRK